MRKLIAGNWKMYGLASHLAEAITVAASLEGDSRTDVMICPPATLIAPLARSLAGSAVAVGAQDCHGEPMGAFTGDISAEQLADAGAEAVIIGHSERRLYHRETDPMIRAKVSAAWRAGLTAILCVGETAEQRAAGETLTVIGRQLTAGLPAVRPIDSLDQALVIAYEPVWAIGSGLTPQTADIVAAHQALHDELRTLCGPAASQPRILYGGSVKPTNARDILALPQVDGALVGGASLNARDLLAIIEAA